MALTEQQKRWRAKNADHVREYDREYRKRNREKDRIKQRKTAIQRKYKLTLDEYEAMVIQQGGRCAICQQLILRTPVIDHDHVTGKVRALLCDLCNRGLGFFKDNILALESAVHYLKKHKEV